ncbi:MAG: hypothetical protein KFB93_07515 [Simkaniaceae bacterium]|jgi:hypothetical protein|nr:MAG: hypothetical protein KFB93_07515 [Simkaniaceae bacterium]
MNLSVQNMPPLEWTTPIQLMEETKVVNQTGHQLDLTVAIYSIDGTQIENAHFLPSEEGHFIIPKPPYHTPERVQVSLFCYQRDDSTSPTYERHISFLDLFRNEDYRL